MKAEQLKLLELLGKIWSEVPDWRFNQLIYNLQNEYNDSRNKVFTDTLFKKEKPFVGNQNNIIFTEVKRVDLHSLADSKFIDFLQKKVGLNNSDLPMKAKLKHDLSFESKGIDRKFGEGAIVDVVYRKDSSEFGSGVGYVIMNNAKDAMSCDSVHLDFNFEGDDK